MQSREIVKKFLDDYKSYSMTFFQYKNQLNNKYIGFSNARDLYRERYDKFKNAIRYLEQLYNKQIEDEETFIEALESIDSHLLELRQLEDQLKQHINNRAEPDRDRLSKKLFGKKDSLTSEVSAAISSLESNKKLKLEKAKAEAAKFPFAQSLQNFISKSFTTPLIALKNFTSSVEPPPTSLSLEQEERLLSVMDKISGAKAEEDFQQLNNTVKAISHQSLVTIDKEEKQFKNQVMHEVRWDAVPTTQVLFAIELASYIKEKENELAKERAKRPEFHIFKMFMASLVGYVKTGEEKLLTAKKMYQAVTEIKIPGTEVDPNRNISEIDLENLHDSRLGKLMKRYQGTDAYPKEYNEAKMKFK